ncbi:cytokinin dehydrogenase 3-like protein [Tanacetum coccineum]
MKRGFLSQKGSGGGRGVKEKSLNRNSMNTFSGIGVSTKSNDTMNEDTPVGVASTVKEDVTPSAIGMMVEKEKITSMEGTTVPESFSPLTTSVTTMADDAPGKSSYANITGKPSGKKVNVRTLYTPEGNRINVVVPVDSIRDISERFANTAYGFFLGKKVAYLVVANYEDVSIVPVWVKLHGVPVTAFSEDGLSAIATKLGTPLMLDSFTFDTCMQSWGRSSYARVMIELRADVELKDNIVVAMPKITREGHYTCAVEKKTVKKHSQTSRGVPISPKMGFKPQKEYRHVPKKPNVSSSGKKKGVEPTIEVSNSNPFDVLNSVDNDVEFGTNKGTTTLVNNEATSSGSSFMNIVNDGEFASNAPIGNPIVPTGIVESDSEVEVVFDETANLRISASGKDGSDKGYGTNSLLEQ